MTNDHPPLADAELAEIEARAKLATPGPWCLQYGSLGRGPPAMHRAIAGGSSSEPLEFTTHDWSFVVYARSWVPRLVAEVHRLRAIKTAHIGGPRGGLATIAEANARAEAAEAEVLRLRGKWALVDGLREAIARAEAAEAALAELRAAVLKLENSARLLTAIREFTCDRAMEEGEKPFNVCDYYNMEDEEKTIRDVLRAAGGEAGRGETP